MNENDSERPNIERMEGVVPDFGLVLISASPTGEPHLDHLGATLDPTFRESIIEFLSQQAQGPERPGRGSEPVRPGGAVRRTIDLLTRLGGSQVSTRDVRP